MVDMQNHQYQTEVRNQSRGVSLYWGHFWKALDLTSAAGAQFDNMTLAELAVREFGTVAAIIRLAFPASPTQLALAGQADTSFAPQGAVAPQQYSNSSQAGGSNEQQYSNDQQYFNMQQQGNQSQQVSYSTKSGHPGNSDEQQVTQALHDLLGQQQQGYQGQAGPSYQQNQFGPGYQ